MHQSTPASGTMKLDEDAIARARDNLEQGAVTPGIAPHAQEICKLLNDALATEWVCVLRYRRHYFTAKGLSSEAIAEEFLAHANEELGHADRLAARIVQLGGEPMLDPDTLSARSHAQYDESTELKAMIRANLVAERLAVEIYRQLIALVADKDPTSAHLLRDILAEEEEHADELSDWLERP
ncbi:ferritin-like domain-containing protein [Comamonas flocculans]|uniref:Ferritin-like domain-containing protein n=1 Tax=Comamonas flocculans TaxID=2597701 RepID=A0A5B8RW91_9BURK|nr:ferritin-like domain-containing protein [Comamonas flocculans]QEA13801.1 ferritin-like domain-containing protein [Comamonas flocculans]